MSDQQRVVVSSGGGCGGCLLFILLFIAVAGLWNWSQGMAAQAAVAAAFGLLISWGGWILAAIGLAIVFVFIVTIVAGTR